MATLDSTGLTIDTLEEIRADINAELLRELGIATTADDKTLIGQLVGSMSERLALLNELLESIYNGGDPDAAVGVLLESLAAITGTTRKVATSSTAVLTLTGTLGTVITAGSQASVGGGERFATNSDATTISQSAWAATTAYVVGDRVTNDTPTRTYVCVAPGTSAGSGGPTGTGSVIVDNLVVWAYVGDGAAAVDVASTSVNTGPIVASTGAIDTIETPIAGWDGVRNAADAVLGTVVESDEDLRISRESELTRAGTGTFEAVRVDLEDVPNVTEVVIFENDTDTVDADGVPAHHFEAMVTGGDAQAIVDQIFASKPLGSGTHGTNSGTATDSKGNPHTIEWSRPVSVNIWVDATITYDATLYPADGDAQVETAILGLNGVTGRDVLTFELSKAVGAVPGVIDASFDFDTAVSPTTDTPITITSRQIAVYDSARTTVASSAGTP